MKRTLFIAVAVFMLLSCNPNKNQQPVGNDPQNEDSLNIDFDESMYNGFIVPKADFGTKRYCFTLDLKEDSTLIEEYKHWHKQEHIWPEIPKGIKQVGITNMEIFLHGTRMFMIMETTNEFDLEKDMKKLAELPKQKDWEEFVWKFQKEVPGAEKGSKWQLMERVYKLK